jgi:hypothetical protein
VSERHATPLPARVLSKSVTGPNGNPAVKIEALAVPEGSILRIEFEEVNSSWRQGVFLATDGALTLAGAAADRLVIWADNAPPELEMDVSSNEGVVIMYNVWDSGRGRGPFESQSATSGMFVEQLDSGALRYSCTDIGILPDFKKLIFRVFVEPRTRDRR